MLHLLILRQYLCVSSEDRIVLNFCVINVLVILSSSLSELIRTVDGGQLSLDWVDNHDNATYPESSTRPTVLILPGLTGNSKQSYVRHSIHQASRRGYRSVEALTCPSVSPIMVQ